VPHIALIITPAQVLQAAVAATPQECEQKSTAIAKHTATNTTPLQQGNAAAITGLNFHY
jgi:hypothetical protein